MHLINLGSSCPPVLSHDLCVGGGAGRFRAWAGNQQLKGAELRLVSCFLTEILYPRETDLHE